MKQNLNQLIQWIKHRQDGKPIFFMTAGLPGSGKSTLIRGLHTAYPELVIASTDDFIEAEGLKLGMNYSEAFKAISFTCAKAACEQNIKSGLSAKLDIVLDQTNCSSKSRKSKLSSIPQSYLKVCLVFDIPDKLLWERLEARKEESGKNIPIFVVKNMMSAWNEPTKNDGFDYIINIVQGA